MFLVESIEIFGVLQIFVTQVWLSRRSQNDSQDFLFLLERLELLVYLVDPV